MMRTTGLAVAMVVCLLMHPAWALRMPMPPMNPKTYMSPSGEYVLHVDPSDSKGCGSGTYRLTKNSTEVWSGQKPFTLCEAGITDEGTVAGYAYTYGIEGFGPPNGHDPGYGDLVIAILSPTGETRAEKHIKRGYGKYAYEDQFPQPDAAGLLVDEDNDRCIIRIEDPDINRRNETWITWQLSTGQPMDEFEMGVPGTRGQSGGFLVDARLLRGTPLILVYWRIYRTEVVNNKIIMPHGGRFDLIDPQGKFIWTLSLPDDYVVAGDKRAESALIERMNGKGAILAADKPREFDVYFAAKGQRVTFAVKPDGKGGWSVQEAGRKPYVESSASAPSPATQPISLATLPVLPFKQLPSTRLKRQVPATLPAVRGVGRYNLDNRGRIAFLRCTRDLPYALALIDQTGQVIREVPLDSLKAPEGYSNGRLAWTGGDTFILAESGSGIEAKALAWRIDVGKATVTPLEGFDCPAVEELAGYKDGGFVALTKTRYESTITDGLQCFDTAGKTLWRIEEHGYTGDPAELFGPVNIAVTSRGQIAVLNDMRSGIQIFSRQGCFERVIELQDRLEESRSYITGITCHPDGSFLVYDFAGAPHIMHADTNGKVFRRFDATYTDGRRVDTRHGIQAAPDGHLWMSDGYTLLRLTPKGSVDLILGQHMDPDQLNEMDGATVDSLGRVYVRERRTQVVHVFGPNGNALHQCKPDPQDHETLGDLCRLAVADSGDVYVGTKGLGGGSAGTHLHFSPEGKRIGTESVGLDSITQDWYFQPDSKSRLIIGYHKAYLVDDKGKVVTTIARRPDGNWFNDLDKAAVAPNGALAIVDDAGASLFACQPMLNLYSADGKPLRTIALPEELGDFPCLAYNGEFLFVTNGHQVLVCDAKGEFRGKFRIAPDDAGDLLCGPFLAAGGRELWFVSSERLEVVRYEIPEVLRVSVAKSGSGGKRPDSEPATSQETIKN